jgi:aspartyl-tRNA(Asn)/glutamyl-tRNA(Gln) amidotransferase subunit C
MTTRIDETQIRHIAHLARLKLTDEQCRRFGDDLSLILTYFEKLGEVDTDGVEPTAHAAQVSNVFRDDEPAASLPTDAVLANAPAQAAGFFKVPKVLDQEMP